MKTQRPGPGLVIFGLALTLRIAWVLLRWSQAGPTLEFPDEELHWQLARNLVSEGALISDDGRFAARMPVYPLFLALFAGLEQTGVLAARLAQALLGAAAAWVAYELARAAAGRSAGLVAGVLVAIDPYAVFFSNLLLTEGLFMLLALALTACAWSLVVGRGWSAVSGPRRAPEGAGPFTGASIGVALLSAAVLMTRPSAAGWIVLLWITLGLLDPQRLRAARRLGLYVLVTAAALLPWGLRNRTVIGVPAWLSTNGGVTLYDAIGPQADGSSDQAFLTELPQLAGLDEVERDRELRRLAFQHAQDDPGRVLSLAAVKLWRTWSLVPNVSTYRGGLIGLVSAVFTAAVLLLAVAGLVRTLAARRRTGVEPSPRRRLHTFLWLPVVYFTLVHCVFIGSLRYRVPLMPFVEIAAATTFVHPLRRGDELRLTDAQ